VPEPLLHRAQIDARPQTSRSNVERNLCSQKLSLSSFARSAHPFKQSRKSSFGLHPEVGNNRLQVLSDFTFDAFNFFTSLAGIGISLVPCSLSQSNSDPACG